MIWVCKLLFYSTNGRCVLKKNYVTLYKNYDAFMKKMALRLHREKKKLAMRLQEDYDAFIEREEKCNLPSLVILVVVRELFRLGLDVMEPFLAPIPFVWQGKELLLCRCLIESTKTGLILSLLVSREDCCASECEIFSSHLVIFVLWDVFEEVRGQIFSSRYDPVLPTAMQ